MIQVNEREKTMTEEMLSTTPGPWIVTTQNLLQRDKAVICVKAGKTLIATTGMEGGMIGMSESTAIANAALIAIAPDMLDALIEIQQAINPEYDGMVDLVELNQKISDVLAKLANEAGIQ